MLGASARIDPEELRRRSLMRSSAEMEILNKFDPRRFPLLLLLFPLHLQFTLRCKSIGTPLCGLLRVTRMASSFMGFFPFPVLESKVASLS